MLFISVFNKEKNKVVYTNYHPALFGVDQESAEAVLCEWALNPCTGHEYTQKMHIDPHGEFGMMDDEDFLIEIKEVDI